jgi:hypothetical protein
MLQVGARRTLFLTPCIRKMMFIFWYFNMYKIPRLIYARVYSVSSKLFDIFTLITDEIKFILKHSYCL